MKLGILADAATGLDFSVFTLEQDWTTGSLPSGWFAGGNEDYNHPIYDGTGSYWDSTDLPGWGGSWSYDASSHFYHSYTTIAKFNIVSISSAYFGVSIAVVGVGTTNAVDADQTDGIIIDIAHNSSPTDIPITVPGEVYIASTLDTDGTIQVYYFDTSSGYNQQLFGDPISEQMNLFDVRHFSLEGEGETKLVRSYHSLNEVLDGDAIGGIVSGWGWVG